jgi:hypothetical protein
LAVVKFTTVHVAKLPLISKIGMIWFATVTLTLKCLSVLRYSEPRMTVLARASRNLAD